MSQYCLKQLVATAAFRSCMLGSMPDPLDWRIMPSSYNIAVSRREWKLVEELINNIFVV